MATRISDALGSRVVGAHVPLNVLLAAIPSLPRPLLSRLTARMIERIDEIDGDPDSEGNGDEQDQSYPEGMGGAWSTANGYSPAFEDAEDCDPEEDDDPAEAENAL